MTPEEIEKEYPKLRIGDIFMLAVFVTEARHHPTSIRGFTKGVGSHKRMLRVLDLVESKMQQLLVYRVKVNPDGTNGDWITDYDQAMRLDRDLAENVPEAMGTRRVPGRVTDAAMPWSLFGDLLGKMFDQVAGGKDPKETEAMLRTAYTALDLRPPR